MKFLFFRLEAFRTSPVSLSSRSLRISPNPILCFATHLGTAARSTTLAPLFFFLFFLSSFRSPRPLPVSSFCFCASFNEGGGQREGEENGRVGIFHSLQQVSCLQGAAEREKDFGRSLTMSTLFLRTCKNPQRTKEKSFIGPLPPPRGRGIWILGNLTRFSWK